MKSDGMPTYHLANVVDDHLMKISHVIRGEEWLPSAPLHVLLYRFLGWGDEIPKFAHLPLILKPNGNGKLSKRVADKEGFPIFPLTWKDPESQMPQVGFKELGFLPEAMVNFLVFLGWNLGSEQELFTLSELIEAFKIEQINKAGTKFDFDKAKWYNQQYIKKKDPEFFVVNLIEDLKSENFECTNQEALGLIHLLLERVTFQSEFAEKKSQSFTRTNYFRSKNHK